jgi:putative peptidoglycan lipid II flippase
VGKLAAAGVVLALVLWLSQAPVAALLAGRASWHDETALLLLAIIGALVYGGLVIALFGKQWLATLRAQKRRAAAPSPLPPPD